MMDGIIGDGDQHASRTLGQTGVRDRLNTFADERGRSFSVGEIATGDGRDRLAAVPQQASERLCNPAAPGDADGTL
jgi:hypothetical protein